MSELTTIMHKRLMDTIRAVRPPNKWKIVVVDSRSLQILGAACKMYDILEENVTLVENIEKKRQPYPSLDALYFLTPCRESVLRLLDDFTAQKTPMYKAAHVHFTSGLDDQLFDDLNRRLKSSGASQYLQSLKEMYVDFLVKESAVFTVEPPSSFTALYSTESRGEGERALGKMAKQLLSVCATLGEDPIIRFQESMANENASDPDAPPPRSPAQQLAMYLQKEVDNFCRLNPNFPPPRNPPQPRATFLIVDRTLDTKAPLLHEFTYQAMINDLLDVEDTENGTGIKFNYNYNQEDGSVGSKEVILDEDDNVYKSIRHLHIAECTDRLIEEFNKFLEENKTAVQSGDRSGPPKDAARSLKDMKEMLSNLPQFQDMKAKYSAHLSIAQECLSIFEKHKLNSVGNLEQNMAVGETPDGDTPKTIVLDMVPLLDDPYVSPMDKARVLMLYIISKEGGLFDDDKHKLLEHAKLKGDLRSAINNLGLLGVKLTRVRSKEKSMRKKRDRRRNRDEETPYELSRYVPTLKKVMESHFTGTLDHEQFPYTRASDMEVPEDGHAAPAAATGMHSSGVSLRTTKPTWSKKSNPMMGGQRTPNGAKLVVFVIGGMSYSEMRSAYEVADAFGRDVYIGTTDVMRPAQFVEAMSQLRMPIPPIKSTIAPYVPPSPPPSSKTSSLLGHMPHLNQSSSHISLSNLSIRSSGGGGTSSSTGTSEKLSTDEKEKKKKKGLKKLFG